MHGAIHWRAVFTQYAHHRERLVLVLGETHVAEAMCQHDGLAQPVLQLLRHIRAEHHVVEIAKRPSLRELQRSAASEMIVNEIVHRGAQHPEAAV